MSFLELAQKRYSVRKYKDVPVEEEKLLQVIEAARLAPSAVNFQPLQLIVLQNGEIKKKVAATYGAEWLQRAPIIIVVCGDHSKSWRRADGKDFCDIDGAIAIDHLTLAAAELGLGTCWVCAFNALDCSKALGLPSQLEPIALLPLGYPADEEANIPRNKKRKKLEEFVQWDGYQG
ncbi:MAG: nitroreductase [Peptococcaceae bacterium BICA1-8]|nr:MAG: nitroreductase [Peptococcaceae bacterium BICA1-8]